MRLDVPNCVQCNAPITWGRICDDCCDKEHARRLQEPPDTSRCRYCGAAKDAPGHSEFICKKREERYASR